MRRSNNGKIIGLTGGIASGKSTVSSILEDKGYPVIDADKIARRVVEIGKPAYVDIVHLFGKNILNENLTLNREKLGKIIFSDRAKRQLLNGIIHPRVTEEIKKEIQNYDSEDKAIFIDIPLLIEEKKKLEATGLVFDEIWLVYVDKDTQIKRLMKRDDINKDLAISKIKSQIPLDEKKQYANVIINNDSDIESLREKVYALLNE